MGILLGGLAHDTDSFPIPVAAPLPLPPLPRLGERGGLGRTLRLVVCKAKSWSWNSLSQCLGRGAGVRGCAWSCRRVCSAFHGEFARGTRSRYRRGPDSRRTCRRVCSVFSSFARAPAHLSPNPAARGTRLRPGLLTVGPSGRGIASRGAQGFRPASRTPELPLRSLRLSPPPGPGKGARGPARECGSHALCRFPLEHRDKIRDPLLAANLGAPPWSP